MSRSKILNSALGAAFMAAICAATPAHAIDPGCYPADVVRNATWNAEGPEKQFTIISGKRPTDGFPANVFTSNADGSVGYQIESDPTHGQLCISAKYMNVKANRDLARPAWVNAPAGSFVDRYLTAQYKKLGNRVIFGATTIVRGPDGKEYAGPQLLAAKADKLIEGSVSGAVLTSDKAGGGNLLFALMDLKTNSNFDKFAQTETRAVQTAALALR